MANECIRTFEDQRAAIRFVEQQHEKLLQEALKMQQFRTFMENGQAADYVKSILIPYLDEYFRENRHYLGRTTYNVEWYKKNIIENFGLMLKQFGVKNAEEMIRNVSSETTSTTASMNTLLESGKPTLNSDSDDEESARLLPKTSGSGGGNL